MSHYCHCKCECPQRPDDGEGMAVKTGPGTGSVYIFDKAWTRHEYKDVEALIQENVSLREEVERYRKRGDTFLREIDKLNGVIKKVWRHGHELWTELEPYRQP